MVTLADIFEQHGAAYQQQFNDRMLPGHRRAMRDITACRTEVMGGHVYTCPPCDHTAYFYHSCRNRHCPQCQGDKAQQWLARQEEMRLPVPYFLLTFTLPSELRPLARRQQKLFYNLLFRTSAAATQALAQDPRLLGGSIGMVGVLHTWGRELPYHPHVHYLVPAGAWDPFSMIWRPCRYKRFLLPVKALSILFRAKFRDALKQSDCFDRIPAAVWRKDWVVDCRAVGGGKQALKYLAAYVFRVAISNRRLVSCSEDEVSFRVRPSGSKQWRLCTLPAMEFIRRFLQHVLPKGFVKVRYYGFFSPGLRRVLTQIRDFLTPYPVSAAPKKEPAQESQAESSAAPGWLRCPLCGRPMQHTRTIPGRKQRWQPP
ncbi:MAG: IS91 family transposase [Anaerolineae bacterium]